MSDFLIMLIGVLVGGLFLGLGVLLGAWLAISVVNMLGKDKPMDAAVKSEVQEKTSKPELKGETKDL